MSLTSALSLSLSLSLSCSLDGRTQQREIIEVTMILSGAKSVLPVNEAIAKMATREITITAP